MSEPVPTPTHQMTPYQFFMLSLCLWALITLAAGSFLTLSPSTRTILNYADNAVCILFFADFIVSLYRAPNRLRYMLSWGWIDLVSSIPTVGALRWGRLARAMRILRVMRAVRSTRALAQFLVARRAESALLASLLLSLLIIVVGSIAVLQFEEPGQGTIQSAQDAMWWAVSTLTTVGYGDTYPITPEGRLVAASLMAAGVGVFGIFSGLVASWFLSPGVREVDTDLAEVRRLLTEIRDANLTSRRSEN